MHKVRGVRTSNRGVHWSFAYLYDRYKIFSEACQDVSKAFSGRRLTKKQRFAREENDC